MPSNRRKPTTPTPSSSVAGGPDAAWFDRAAADRAVRFIEKFLRHVKGVDAGHRFELEAWQRDLVVRPAFGWKLPDGSRLVRRIYVEMGRKNGKSTLGAALALLLTFADDEPGAEVYSAAADRDQAAIIFDIARQMVENCPALRSRCEVYRRSIVVHSTGSAYHVLSADAPTKHGKNAHGVVFDELHAQPNRDLWDVLTTATASRRQPMVIALTTAGYDRNSICWEQHDYALKVRDGIIPDPSFLPIVFAAEPDDDWRDERTWAKANPSLGAAVRVEYLRKEAERAAETPAAQNTFRRLHLSQWTEQSVRWLDMAAWDACAGGEDVDLSGRACWGGLDLASTMDLAAFVLVFWNEKRLVVRCRFWIPEDTIRQRARRDRVPYDVWAAQGFVEATQGNVVDYGVIRQRILEDFDRYDIREIAFDRWNATHIVQELQEDGLNLVPFGQGFKSMSGPTKELERHVVGMTLAHGGHPVLRWNASNVAARQDPAGNIKPDRARSFEKIDGIVALVMALGRAMLVEGQEVADDYAITML